jgi:hypothetical protein
MKRAILAALAVCGFAGAAAAAPAPLLTHWDTKAVQAGLTQVGAADVRVADADGLPMITARTRDGLTVGVYAKACDASTVRGPALCHGLEGIVSFDPGPNVDRAAIVARLNATYASGKFILAPDGTVRLSRYVDFDGGVSAENLRAELTGYFALAGVTARTLWPAPDAR